MGSSRGMCDADDKHSFWPIGVRPEGSFHSSRRRPSWTDVPQMFLEGLRERVEATAITTGTEIGVGSLSRHCHCLQSLGAGIING